MNHVVASVCYNQFDCPIHIISANMRVCVCARVHMLRLQHSFFAQHFSWGGYPRLMARDGKGKESIGGLDLNSDEPKFCSHCMIDCAKSFRCGF